MTMKFAPIVLVLTSLAFAIQRPNIPIANFEGADYGDWKATGEAFGSAPAHGTLSGQQSVSGFRGRGLVNTFLKGDGTVGTLTSPPFKIERKYINLLVGGGAHAGRTCVNLLIDGKVVRTATGAENERLEWTTWEVEELDGKSAVIQIVDNETGGWGHINVDEIAQSDKSQAFVIKTSPLYEETYRPQFHFTAQKGWLNDPNGLVFVEGEYHLFFQHNPKGTEWGNMTWGHAVSEDLLHWKQLPNALEPDKMGTMFSGSAVIDEKNTSGFGKTGEKPLVLIYTAAGGTSPESKGQPFTQCIAYSLDKGRTFKKYAGNPVLNHVAGENRDPKVVWHGPTRRWIMALYLTGSEFVLYSSPNLKQWTELQRITMPGCSECPDFFPMKTVGGGQKWVFTAANGKYLVGNFDGKKFTPESGPQQVEFGAQSYAVQTYSGIPARDGRVIQLAWMNGGSFPRMPFNQQMAFPSELTLRKTPDGLRLFKLPVREIEKLRGKPLSYKSTGLSPGFDATEGWRPGEAFEVEVEADMGNAIQVEVKIFGEPIAFSRSEGELRALGRTAPLFKGVKKLQLRVLLDKTSLEIFENDRRTALTSSFRPQWSELPIEVHAIGGKTGPMTITAYALASVWPTSR
jgi:sucrose-6-phosphate hydrolase SacC (GH32 family)